MKEEIIGKRYAKALIRIGQESGTWRQIGEDLDSFTSALQQHDILRRVLCDPIHERTKRKAILKVILERMGMQKLTGSFLQLLLDKERIRYLSAIQAAYTSFEDTLAGRLRAKVYSARKLSEDEVQAVRESLGKRFKKQIVLETLVDPEILGGIICKVDGIVFDGSVSTQLEKIRETTRGE